MPRLLVYTTSYLDADGNSQSVEYVAAADPADTQYAEEVNEFERDAINTYNAFCNDGKATKVSTELRVIDG